MQITKFGQSCVRIEHEGHVVVFDPGCFTGPEAVAGATAVLVTHEHPDHWTIEHLRAAGAPVFTTAEVAGLIAAEDGEVAARVTAVSPGETFDVGLPVRALGGDHAEVHSEFPHCRNLGFVLTVGDKKVYHPGDALVHPGEDIDVLLLPISAIWCKLSEVVEFARSVGAPRTIAIHDADLHDLGAGITDGSVTQFLGEGNSYHRVPAGTVVP
jgi:L-ascorbate metabolism protein UlaG (beta-lactamase superfamily)